MAAHARAHTGPHLPRSGKEDILRLQVPVEYLLLVDVLQRHAHLNKEVEDLAFWKGLQAP